MATRTAKLRIELDGEKQYKQALSELNKGNQVLASEMRKLAAEYAGNEKSIEALTKKGDILQRQLLQQKDKVQTLRDALKNAANQYGEADKRTQEWQIKLNDAEAAQFKLEHAIEENNKALNGQGTEMVSLGDAVGELAGKLGIQIPDGAKKALNGMQGMSAGSVAALGAIAAGVAAVIKVVKELNNITLEAAANADDLITKSMTTGLSTTRLQQFRYAAPFIDVDEGTLTGSLTKITKSLNTARDQYEKYNESMLKAAQSGKEFTGELGTQAAAFSQLGVSITDANGELRNNEEVSFEVLEALSGMGNETERDALAMALFGKSAQELNPLILNLDEAQRLYNEAMSEGYVLSEDQLKILGQVDDENQKLTQTKEKYANMIAVRWAPANKEAYETLADLMSMAGDALVDSRLIENTAELISNTLKLVDGGAKLISKIPTWLNPINNLSRQFEFLNKTISGTLNLLGIQKNEMKGYGGLGSDIAGATWKDDVQAWVSAGGTIIGDWNYKDFDKSTGKLTRVFDYGSSGDVVSYGKLSEAEIRRLIGHNAAGTEYWKGGGTVYNAAGTDNWRGGLTWVGENGPELVSLPRGSRIYNNQESREMVSGDTNIYINVNGIQELNEVVDWYQSRQVRGRMR